MFFEWEKKDIEMQKIRYQESNICLIADYKLKFIDVGIKL